MKVLLLAANPSNTSRLRLDKEAREIEESLRRTHLEIEFEARWAVRTRDLQRALLDLKPDIVHFSGHGDGNKGLILEGDKGRAHFLPNDAIEGLFRIFSKYIQCVILNACYSEVQAKAIVQHIPYVMGMNNAIDDEAAVEFSRSFYDALGSGESINFSYDLACNAIHLLAIKNEHLTPVLLQADTQRVGRPTLQDVDNTVCQTENKADDLRREGLEHRQRVLLDKLNRLERTLDLEGRVEEQMRMEARIAETKEALNKIRATLNSV